MKRISDKTNRKVGLVISYVLYAVQICVSLFFTPFVLQILGDREYGLYTFSTSITTWMSTILTAMGAGYSKYLMQEKQRDPENGEQRAAGVFLKIFLVLSILILFVGGTIAALFFTKAIPLENYTDAEKNIICIIMIGSTICISVTTALTCYKSYLYYKQAYIIIYLLGFLTVFLQTGISYICLLSGMGVISIAMTHFGVSIFVSLIETAVSVFYERERVKLKIDSEEERRTVRNMTKSILLFSSFVLLRTVSDTLNRSMDTTILGFVNPDVVTKNSLALNLANYMVNITTIIGNIFAQKLNECYFSENGRQKTNALFLRVSMYQLLIAFLIVGGFMSCGYEFVLMWIGIDRIDVFWVAAIAMLAYVVSCTTTLSNQTRILMDLHKGASLIYLMTAILNLILSVLLCALLGNENALWWCLIGTVLSTVIGQWIILTIYDKKKTGLPVGRYWLNFISVLVVAGASCGIVQLIFGVIIDLSSLRTIVLFFIKGISFVVIYCLANFFLHKRLFLDLFRNTLFKRKRSNQAN